MQNNQYNSNYNNQYNNQQLRNEAGQSDYHEGFDSGYDSGYRAAMQMQNKVNQQKDGSKLAIVIKSIIIAVLSGFIMLFIIGVIGFAVEEFSDDTANHLEWCDDCYIDGDYRSLSHRVTSYATDDSRFDIYKEAVEGYNLYLECHQWIVCVDEQIEGSKEMFNEKYNLLKELEKNSTFDSNKKIFAEFIKEIDDLR